MAEKALSETIECTLCEHSIVMNENGRPQWSAGKRIFCCLRTVSMISSSRQDAFSQE